MFNSMYAEAYYILDKRICNKTIGIYFHTIDRIWIFFQPLISMGNDKNPSMFLLIPINFDVLVFVQEIYELDGYLNKGKFPRDIIVLVYFPDICAVYRNFHFRLFYKSFVLIQKLKTPQAKLATKYSCVLLYFNPYFNFNQTKFSNDFPGNEKIQVYRVGQCN